jgi:ubiquinone/menaquinone biosynthesis C-methylase UbiE
MNDVEARARAGIERFNTVASAWDDSPMRAGIATAVAGAIIDAISPTGTERAMELGCGTGLLTGLLASNVASVVAVDGSSGMLDVLRRKLRETRIGNVEPLEANIALEMPAGPFDLVFSSMVLHHIADVPALFARLHDRLAPKGRVALADLAREDGSFHSADVPDVMHHGFDPEELTRWLKAAGFTDIAVRTAHVVRKPQSDGSTREYPVLLYSARRGAVPAA